MFLNNKLKSIFLTLDGHNDPALNINWFEALKRGKICHKNWHSKNKELIQEKVFNLSKKIKANITPAFKLPKQYKELFFSDEGSLKKKLVKVILDGEIKKDKDFASLIILLNDKYYRKFEICYYLRLITELIDNELIFNSLCLSDLKKKKSFPHGWHNYNSDFLKYSFYENYKKDLSILKLLNYKKNRKPNKKNFNLDDGVQYKYFDRYSIYSYKHQIDRSKIQKNREIIKNELTALWVKSKWKNEDQILNSRREGLESVALRFFNVYGIGQRPDSAYAAVIPKFVDLIVNQQPPIINGDGLQTRDFVHVNDVAQAIFKFLEPTWVGQKYHVFNVATQTRLSLLDLIENINNSLTQINPHHTRITPTFGPERPGDIRHSMASNSRLMTETTWEQSIDFPVGIFSLVKEAYLSKNK